MEMTKTEIAAIQEASEKVKQEIKELQELELSLIGGGSGEVVFG